MFHSTPDLTKARKQSLAYRVVAKAIYHGEIPPARQCICAICGSKARYYHHDDYDKPLEVTPLCPKCHSYVHGLRSKPGVKETPSEYRRTDEVFYIEPGSVFHFEED